MVDGYPGDRVLIGETYLPTTAAIDKWYGGARHDELQLPMDLLVGFAPRLDAGVFRRHLLEVETQIHGSQPLLVFDNHDNVRSWDRFGDGVHNLRIAKVVATLLLASRATALMYQGEELGQPTTTPTRVEDVRDPIGITGWPKEKGRDGERTPMQWDDSNRQAGFSTNPKTWLPVPASYTTTNVKAELADPQSVLNWYRQLIALRRSNPALHDGRMAFLDQGNASVLSFARVDDAGRAVLIALNMTGGTQTVSLDPAEAGARGTRVTTLMTSEDALWPARTAQAIELPPFACWVASVE
jgi:alpha-glucosidase